MFVPNLKFLGPVVPEEFLMKKKIYTHTNIVTEKTKTIYPLYTAGARGLTMTMLHNLLNQSN